jgi:hypothetical protein
VVAKEKVSFGVVFCLPFSISILRTLQDRRDIAMRRLHFALLFFVLVLAAQSQAEVYYVQSGGGIGLPPCTSLKGGYFIFPSIQYAVNHVPAGATINVCPGTYYEQVTISQPLTLKAVTFNNSPQVVIAVPSDGLAPTSSLF